MANGDDAAAAGMDTVPGVSDLRLGYEEINKSRDYLARHQTTGTHDAAAITTGTIAPARLPVIVPSELAGGGMTFKPVGGTQYTVSKNLGILGILAVTGSCTFENNLSLLGNATVNGSGSFGGPLSSGPLTAAGAVRFQNAPTYNPGSSDLLYINSNGYIGVPPSARRYKRNIKPVPDSDLTGIGQVQVCEWDYLKKLGGDHESIGAIAEDLQDAGLDRLIVRNDDGEVERIREHKVVWAVLAYTQQLEQRLTELEQRVMEAGL